MAVTSGFFNSKNGDRKYNAENISRYFDKLISSGVFPVPSTNLQVTAAGTDMTVTVAPGRGMLDCHWLNNDAPIKLTIAASDVVLSRIDAVIMKLDLNESGRQCTLEVKKGAFSDNPQVPVMTRTDYVKEYALAYVRVDKLTTKIVQAHITDTRANTAVCGWVTGLITQVDTSSLWSQWQDAYQRFFDQGVELFETWYDNLQSQASSIAPVRKFEATYTTQAADEQVIPIGISEYTPAVDVLNVYVNGFRMKAGTDYTESSATQITLTRAVKAGTPVTIEVLKNTGSAA